MSLALPPVRIATAHVFGAPLRRVDHNAGRERLLSWIVDRVATNPAWAALDALLLPAGYLALEAPLGPMPSHLRHQHLSQSAISFACRSAATRLAWIADTLLVVGIDTRPYLRGFSGDQMMVAWRGDAIVGSARKVFPSPVDTAPGRRRPLLLFDHDADDPARIVSLSGGRQALLCVCYDAFVFSELAVGPTGKRANLRHLWKGKHAIIEPDADERAAFLDRHGRLIGEHRPDVALVGVHGFDQPGRETRWQRHGIAVASAGLGGGLAVGAAHYRWWLPEPDDLGHSTLASKDVARRHLKLGLNRPGRKLQATNAMFVAVPGSPHLAATIRLFEG